MNEPDQPQPAENNYPVEIDCQAVKNLLDEQERFLLLDRREQVEYNTAKIDGAMLIPMTQLQQRVDELEAHRDARIVVHCHLGGRSLQVTHWLRQLGYERTQNMTGGIDAWSVQIDREVPRYG